MPRVVGEWRFTAVEFDVLWRVHGRDRLPYPMQFRGEADIAAAHRLARRDAARRIASMLGEELHGALSVLLDPAVRVEVCGFAGASVTRVHAGISDGSGVVVRQLPGVDLDSGGDVLISVMPSDRAAAAVAAALPPAVRGAGRGLTARPESDGAVMRPVGGRGTPEDLRAFFARPRAGIGEIGIHPGPAVDWRPDDDGVVLHWLDVADGRYLVRGSDVVEVLPVSADELGTQLAVLVDRVGRPRQANTTSHTAM